MSAESSLLARLLLKHEVEDFLYREADLLDERRYEEWLDLFTEDAHYWMPLRRNVPREKPEREIRPERVLALGTERDGYVNTTHRQAADARLVFVVCAIHIRRDVRHGSDPLQTPSRTRCDERTRRWIL